MADVFTLNFLLLFVYILIHTTFSAWQVKRMACSESLNCTNPDEQLLISWACWIQNLNGDIRSFDCENEITENVVNKCFRKNTCRPCGKERQDRSKFLQVTYQCISKVQLDKLDSDKRRGPIQTCHNEAIKRKRGFIVSPTYKKKNNKIPTNFSMLMENHNSSRVLNLMIHHIKLPCASSLKVTVNKTTVFAVCSESLKRFKWEVFRPLDTHSRNNTKVTINVDLSKVPTFTGAMVFFLLEYSWDHEIKFNLHSELADFNVEPASSTGKSQSGFGWHVVVTPAITFLLGISIAVLIVILKLKPKIQQPGVARDQHNYEYISLPRNNGRTLLAPSASQPGETNTAGPQESHYSLAFADITEPTSLGSGTSTVTNKRLVYFELENPLDKLVAAADDPKTGEDDVQQQSENQAEMKREAEDAEIVLITNKSYCEVNVHYLRLAPIIPTATLA
eukprot:GHVU01094982.1.p1 GENE.GHVU01094982.1~~GHVU01094982.1.p1  ORF type:complete len:449 (-),score=39.67 GHVU01094982.1:803-2149(-)